MKVRVARRDSAAVRRPEMSEMAPEKGKREAIWERKALRSRSMTWRIGAARAKAGRKQRRRRSFMMKVWKKMG